MKTGNPSPDGVYLSGMSIRPPAPLTALLVLAACTSAPPYQGIEEAELFAMGQREIEAGNENEAQEVLDRLLIVFPNFERAAEVRMMLAESYYRDEEYITALSEYQRFLNRYPSHPSAPDAALGRCRSSAALSPSIPRDQSYTGEAEVVCGNVVADYPGTAAADEAQRVSSEMRVKLAEKEYSTGEYYFRRGYFDSAIIYWQFVEVQYLDTIWAPKALLGIMNAYEEIGYQDLVEETKQKLLDMYPDSEEALGLADGSSAMAAPSGGAR